MRLSELKNKEIIDVESGVRLGRITECEVSFDATSGRLYDIMIPDTTAVLRLFGKTEMKRIKWHQIRKISQEFVLIGREEESIPYE